MLKSDLNKYFYEIVHTSPYHTLQQWIAGTGDVLNLCNFGKTDGNTQLNEQVVSKPSATIPMEKVTIYPNPATNTLIINGASGASINIIDITGRLFNKGVLKTNTVNIEQLPDGMYIITLRLTNGEVYSQKILVRH